MSSITSTNTMFGSEPGMGEGFRGDPILQKQECDSGSGDGTEIVSAVIDLSGFDTSNVTDMDRMFLNSTLDSNHVTGLRDLDLSSMTAIPSDFAASGNIPDNRYPLSSVEKQPNWASESLT